VIGIYAITDTPPKTLPLAEELRRIECGELVAFCGPGGERRVSADLLWRHEHIVETLMKTCDLLPVRYGTQVEDEPAAVRVLERRRSELKAALDRVRGAVELGLRVVAPSPDPGEPPAPRSGAEYLRAKARAAGREERLAERVHEPLEGMARASHRRQRLAGRELLAAAYLVDRGAVSAFIESVAAIQAANPDLRLLCTGPWPPYSFVSE
jgi:Gas vesicle synthesis protein GvpL/GvpF